MKRTQTIASILVLGFSFASGLANATSINERQHKQQHRIEQGINSGELNRKEAHRLRHQQTKIARKEASFKSDGVLTKKERLILQKDLNNTSARIHQQKHDNQNRH